MEEEEIRKRDQRATFKLAKFVQIEVTRKNVGTQYIRDEERKLLWDTRLTAVTKRSFFQRVFELVVGQARF